MLTHIHPVQRFLLVLAVALFGANMALAQSVPMLVQAEAMTLVAPMAAGYDIAAMGGRFISPTSGTSTMNPVRSASVQVGIPAAGTYYLWARIAGPTDLSDALYVGIDTSFDRIFPSTTGVYEWVRVETNNGSGVFGFALTAGTHDLQVGYGEIGAKLDALYLTADAAEVPAFTPPARLAIEAEALNLSPPMTVGSEPAANGGGQFISPTSGTTSTTPVREASTSVQVPAGTYYLWARIAGPTDTSDALYVGIDSSFARVFPTTVTSGSYEWVKVATSDGGTVFGFALTAGAHIVQVGHGEIGAKLDGVYLTTDANEVPTLAPMRRVIEAETMTLTAPMTVGVEAAANGAQYISPTSGTDTTVPVREASTTVNAPAAGTYYLWARLKGLTDASDALYVGFDNSWDRVFPSSTGAYEWVRVETVDGSGIHGFSLSAGEHVIQVGHGEIGARLDAVYVTDDANDSPGGATPAGFPATCAPPSGGYEGFGRNTTGGAAFASTPTHVTNLNDSGPGSLREALSTGNRCIVFDVGGTIDLNSQLIVRSNVTIDGFTAPSLGITLRNNAPPDPTGHDSSQPALNIFGGTGVVSNVIVRGIRIRHSPGDGISVVKASNVVIDRVSVSGFGDGAIDITDDTHDVTMQWSILGNGDPAHNLPNLIRTATTRVTVHHNLYVNTSLRNPLCTFGAATLATEVVCDVRNNLVWNYTFGAIQIDFRGTANIVNNYYSTTQSVSPSEVIRIGQEPGSAPVSAFVDGNFSNIPIDLSSACAGCIRSTPWPAVVPATDDATTAARRVRAQAGARGPNFGLDSTDQAFINSVSIP